MQYQKTNVNDLKLYPASRFWMRFVSFVDLRNLIKLLQEYPAGLTAKEIVSLVKSKRIFLVKGNHVPSLTTIYHYRNTLLHLGILQRKKNLLQINNAEPLVTQLLENLGTGDTLDATEKHFFGELVIAQDDCRLFFADLFLIENQEKYSLDTWLRQAKPISWRETGSVKARRVTLETFETNKVIELSTENHIQALLYGVRYWFRDELQIIDELFREDVGNVMFPIFPTNQVTDQIIILKLMEQLNSNDEWTRINLRDLASSLCIQLRISVQRLYNVIQDMHRAYPGFIVLIPTSKSFAAVTASSNLRENYELKSYMQQKGGVYISHIRIHQKIKEVLK